MSRAPEPEPAGVLGIDVGTMRVGVAGSDDTHTLATPLIVLRRGAKDFWQRLGSVIDERGAGTIVVGLPLHSTGDEGAAARMARHFAAELNAHTACRVLLWDERFTSAEAERTLLAHGVRRARRRERIDAVAAALLLQSWLDRQRAAV